MIHNVTLKSLHTQTLEEFCRGCWNISSTCYWQCQSLSEISHLPNMTSGLARKWHTST